MQSTNLSLPSAADNTSRFIWNGLSRPVEGFGTSSAPESGVRARHQKLDDLLRGLPLQLRPHFAFDYMSLFLNRGTGLGWLWYVTDDQNSFALTSTDTPPGEESLLMWAVTRQRDAVIGNIEDQSDISGVKKSLLARGINSICVAPLTTIHGPVGAIFVGSKATGAYSREHERFFSAIADHIAVAADNALSHAELRREKTRLKLLLELTNQTVSSHELRDVVQASMMSIRSGFRCDGVCMFLESPEGGGLQAYALDFPGDAGFQEGATISLSGTIAGHVVQTASPWSGSREEACAHFPRQLLLTPGFATGCMLPIPGRQRVAGTLGLVRRENHSFSQDEIDFLMQASSQIAIAVENALAYRQIRELKEKLAQEEVYVQDEIRDETHFEEIVGKSTALRRVLAKVETVAPTDSTVLICGETGTGKELIAHAIHNLSPRHGNAFVKLNCAAIPTGLLESELFGHEKGAFTSAIAQRIGRFELAHRGTIFLDEVGEIPLELQTKLLRVLQEREFERLGSTRTVRTDARLIAATNRNLAEMVQEQNFRSDLFYRLNVFPIRVPALRERPEDIPLLVRHFVQHFAQRMNRVIDTIPSETMSALVRYPWPGNIRELQNLIERAVILSNGPVLRVPLQDLPNRPVTDSTARPQTMEEAERAHIMATLKDTKWVIAGPNGAAARLGMNRATVYFRMKKLGIVKPWKIEN